LPLRGIDQTVGVSDRLWVQISLHGQALQAQSGFLHEPALLAVPHGFLLHLELAIEENFLLFVLDNEGWLTDGGAIPGLAHRCRVLLLVTLLVCGFSVRLAIEDHLLPSFESFEDVEDVFVHGVMRLGRAHKSAELQAVVFEHALVRLRHPERLQASLILEFQTGLSCAVLHRAQDLNQQSRVLDHATTATDLLIGDVSVAVLALVLDLDELDVCDEAKHLDHMPDDLIRRDRLNQLDLIISLEVCHLVLHLANYFEIGAAEHELGVDVDRDRDLPHSILHEQDHSALQSRFQIDAAIMLDEEGDFRFIISAF